MMRGCRMANAVISYANEDVTFAQKIKGAINSSLEF